MPSLAIHTHNDSPAFETSDEATVAAVREALEATVAENAMVRSDRHLVPAHDLAAILRTVGRKHWASVLGHEEEASMVTVVFS